MARVELHLLDIVHRRRPHYDHHEQLVDMDHRDLKYRRVPRDMILVHPIRESSRDNGSYVDEDGFHRVRR